MRTVLDCKTIRAYRDFTSLAVQVDLLILVVVTLWNCLGLTRSSCGLQLLEDGRRHDILQGIREKVLGKLPHSFFRDDAFVPTRGTFKLSICVLCCRDVSLQAATAESVETRKNQWIVVWSETYRTLQQWCQLCRVEIIRHLER